MNESIKIEDYYPFVGSIVKHYLEITPLYSLDYDDLFQFGIIGLIEAKERFDPNKNTKFITYSYYWIRKHILKGIDETDLLVKRPRYKKGIIK